MTTWLERSGPISRTKPRLDITFGLFIKQMQKHVVPVLLANLALLLRMIVPGSLSCIFNGRTKSLKNFDVYFLFLGIVTRPFFYFSRYNN